MSNTRSSRSSTPYTCPYCPHCSASFKCPYCPHCQSAGSSGDESDPDEREHGGHEQPPPPPPPEEEGDKVEPGKRAICARPTERRHPRRSHDSDVRTTFIVVCHGETVGECFPGWTRLAFVGQTYRPYNMNMPKKIYSSPELRCVQTAAAIAEALENSTATICIDPSLADWVQFSPNGGKKNWLSKEELKALKYPICNGYTPVLDRLPDSESPDDYFKRLGNFFLALTESDERHVLVSTDYHSVVIVSNAHALEVAMNRQWKNASALCDVRRNIRNCDVVELDITKDTKVITRGPKLLPFTKTKADALEVQ
ncbi:unnamed protein product [Nippostrongylus brasiliensis]|uniref:Protein UBASH3A homolog (inferred by orthology to a D. melanogaster protein) n=1 Tax=Nippostrongylus brasiliensis TaxID=27835 RepID=A0A0N4Y9E4_NIPBR|nr:unnamed protein product [Nippostrongylus brasiliensis]